MEDNIDISRLITTTGGFGELNAGQEIQLHREDTAPAHGLYCPRRFIENRSTILSSKCLSRSHSQQPRGRRPCHMANAISDSASLRAPDHEQT